MYLRILPFAIFLLFIAQGPRIANGLIQQRPPRPVPTISESDYLPEFTRPNVIRTSGTRKAEGVSMPISSEAPARFYSTADRPESFQFSKRVVNDSVSSGVTFSTLSSFDCGGLPCNSPFEPVAAASGNNVFITANKIAVSSSSLGSSWLYANPAGTHSSFCCDQDVLFSPQINRFIWWRQGLVSVETGMNVNTLVVSSVNSTTPQYLWTLQANDFDGTITNLWLDYPKIDVTTKFLYLTWSLYDLGGAYSGSAVARIPLLDLNAGGALRKEFVRYSNNGIALVTGVGLTSMWYLMELPAAYCCSVVRWDDDQPYPVAALRPIPYVYVGKGDVTCPDSNGEDACSKVDSRKMAGFYAAPGIVGFMWMQKSQIEYGLPLPFVGYATFNATTLEPIISDGVIASDEYAIVYPGAAGGSGSNVAVSFYGAGNNTKHFFALSALGSQYMRPIFQNTMAASSDVKWGDYTRLRPYFPDSNSFVAVGYRMNGTCAGPLCNKLEGVFIVFNTTSAAGGSPVDESPISPPLAPPLPSPTAPPPQEVPNPPVSPPMAAPAAPPFDAPNSFIPTPSTSGPAPSSTNAPSPSGSSSTPDGNAPLSPSGASSSPSSSNNQNNGYVDPTPAAAAAVGAILGLVLVGLVIAIILKKKNVF